MVFDADYLVAWLAIGGKTLQIGGIGSPYQFLRGGLEGTASPETVQRFGENAQLDGCYTISRRLAARDILLRFEAADAVQTETLRRELIRFFVPKAAGTLRIRRGEVTRSIGCSVVGAVNFVQETLWHPLRVSVHLLCSDPCFYAPDAFFEPEWISDGLFSFPLTATASSGVIMGISVLSESIRVSNPGEADSGFILKVQLRKDPSGGAKMENPVIRLAETGAQIRVHTALAEGDVLTVSTVPGHKFIRVNDVPCMRFDRESMFFSLPPGESTVEILCDEKNADGTEKAGILRPVIHLRPRCFGI